MIIKLSNSPVRQTGKSENSGLKDKGLQLSVGLKMMLGVGLISIFSIGFLVYMNFQAFSQVGIETQALLDVNTSMNKELRASVFDLQKKYLELPKLLQVNAADEIREWIKNRYSVNKEAVIDGPENYRKFFNRSQRRDISKGNFVVQKHEGGVVLSNGILDKNGYFSDKVNRIQLSTRNPVKDAQDISDYINGAVEKADRTEALAQRVLLLKNLLADEAIDAEKSRNAILYKVEDIENKKAQLIAYREHKQQLIVLMAVLTILLNLVLLYFMAWFVVEKPLKCLTRSIDQINGGEMIELPYQTRKDQIGVLAGVLEKFQTMLIRLKDEDIRKKARRRTIRELIQQMSAMIETIQMKAGDMKKSALELSCLAADTENQTTTASESASRTVEQTHAVSYSARQLQSSVQDISRQILKQNELVKDINDVTQASRRDMKRLHQASTEINGIVDMVKNIAGQTKLLALNARIEAARSGEAGKGFTIVAREVKALSMQTESANEDIAGKIAAIQKACKTIVEYTQQTDSRMERLMLASHQISAAVEEQDAVTRGIFETVHATADDMQDVNTRISMVNDAARVTSRFAGSVQSYSELIEGQLAGLLHETREKLSEVGLTRTKAGGSSDSTGAKDHLTASDTLNKIQVKKGPYAA